MLLANTGGISVKVQIPTGKNYSFHSSRNDLVLIFETITQRFSECDGKELQELKENAKHTDTDEAQKAERVLSVYIYSIYECVGVKVKR